MNGCVPERRGKIAFSVVGPMEQHNLGLLPNQFLSLENVFVKNSYFVMCYFCFDYLALYTTLVSPGTVFKCAL